MKANLKNTNINYHIVREDFSESDMDGNITINVSYINRRNMSAKEAREHIQQIKKYAEEHNLKNLFIIEDNNPESPMNFSKGLNEILAMIQALNEGKSNMRIARIIVANQKSVSKYYGNYLLFIRTACSENQFIGNFMDRIFSGNEYGIDFTCFENNYHFDPYNKNDKQTLDQMIIDYWHDIDMSMKNWK